MGVYGYIRNAAPVLMWQEPALSVHGFAAKSRTESAYARAAFLALKPRPMSTSEVTQSAISAESGT